MNIIVISILFMYTSDSYPIFKFSSSVLPVPIILGTYLFSAVLLPMFFWLNSYLSRVIFSGFGCILADNVLANGAVGFWQFRQLVCWPKYSTSSLLSYRALFIQRIFIWTDYSVVSIRNIFLLLSILKRKWWSLCFGCTKSINQNHSLLPVLFLNS